MAKKSRKRVRAMTSNGRAAIFIAALASSALSGFMIGSGNGILVLLGVLCLAITVVCYIIIMKGKDELDGLH